MAGAEAPVTRKPVAAPASKSNSTSGSTSGKKETEAALRQASARVGLSEEPFLTFRDALRVLGAIVLAVTLSSWIWTGGQSAVWGLPRPWWTKPAQLAQLVKPQLQLTNAELAAYDGSDPSKPILLALNRTIYDVSSSPKVYGVGGMYSTLAAKDASRSYITTCFDPKDDLVPYLGGVEEVFVPLWLSRKPSRAEMDEIAPGEIMNGLGVGDLLDKMKQKIGLRKTRKLQDEAYAKARERVAAQVKTWEAMFEKKGYPVVGRVVGVDESDPKLWKKLKFCEKALKQRPSMADSLGEAMLAITGSDKIDIGKMQSYMKKGKEAMGLNTDDDDKASPGSDKKAAEAAAAAAVAGDSGKRTKKDMQGNADASVADMMKKGQYAAESKEQAERMAGRDEL